MNALTASQAASVLAAARYVLLDFDGPICSIYAGRAARLVAEELAALIAAHEVTVPADVLTNGDPLDVLRHAGRTGGVLLSEVEQALRTAELAAAETAIPTPGGSDLLNACHRTGRPVAIVSNNSAPAVARYLERVELAPLVSHVEGRIAEKPWFMKPHRALIDQAAKAIGASANASVFIGDSLTDVRAARAGEMPCIGYANKPGKAEELAGAGAVAVIDSMVDLAAALADTPSR